MKPVISLFAVMAALGLTACVSSDMSDLRTYVERIKQRPAGRIEPLPEVKPFPGFVYAATELPDPFLIPEIIVDDPVRHSEKPCNRPDPNRVKEELEKFTLDGLKMVGAVNHNLELFALIRDNQGIIYRIREGNYLGNNNGLVQHVYEDRIELLEIVPDGQGCWIERPATVALQE